MTSGGSPRRTGAGGFSMIELAMVLIVFGIILSAGIVGWRSFLETRRIAKSASTMYQVKDCILRRVAFSGRYPTYSGTLSCENGWDPTMDVDNCTCDEGVRDSWGQRFYFIEGFNGTQDGLKGHPLITDPAKGLTRMVPGADSDALDHRGNAVEDIAFILVGVGEDGAPCDAGVAGCSYDFFGGDFIGNLTIMNPDFRDQDDDVYVIVTSHELLGILK